MGFESLYKLSVILNVVDNMTNPLKNSGRNARESVDALTAMQQTFGSMTQTGTIMTGAGVQIAEALASPVEATFETKRAISELASLGVEQLGLIEDAAKDFSDTWAGTTKADFISASYDIKSGIASLTDEGVARYTELSGLTATATKANISTMTSLFATGYGIYKDYYNDLSDMEFAEMFSAGISTSVKQFKTNGNEMASAIQTLGASATNAQVPLEEQLSILGMLQATMSGSEAGTKYTAFLRSAAKGGDALGLSFVDANNQLLSMPEILDKLRSKFGDTIDAAEKMELQKAFGDAESVKLIDLLYNKTGDLQNNIVGMYDALGRGTEVTLEMADAINSSDPAAFDLIKQKAHNLSETIGNMITPKVREYGEKISGVIEKAEKWVSNHETLVTGIFMVLAVLAAFLTVGGIVITTIGVMGGAVIKGVAAVKKAHTAFKLLQKATKSGIQMLGRFGGTLLNLGKTAVTSLINVMKPLIASVWSFTSALLANPVTWIVIGIVALIAVIVILYNKCEWFRDLVNSLGTSIKEGFGKALQSAREMLAGMADIYNEHGGGIQGIAAVIMSGVTGIFSAGYNLLDKLTGGKLSAIRDKWAEKLGPVKEIAGKILSAAKSTIKEKLDNMKDAYNEHGGGIQGIAAAAVEGVKGYYTAGFTFIDKLTGGKLSAIRDKFASGIDSIKSKIANSIQWFRNSGQKIMDTFTEGIKSAINKPVEAVKSGLQKIRNMLPFSDAKEGPLDSLTLSGTKVMSTLSSGIEMAENLPAEAVKEAFGKMSFSAETDKRADAKKETRAEDGGRENRSVQWIPGRRTVIENLNLNVDLKTIKDLKLLLSLVEEIEDQINSNEDDIGLQPV